ncbi:MAG: hypothetical protein LRZ99_04360, partial [Desulfotomaculum sp.]|nr:hypothetical protein [Desulfotomaculum sp.]
MKIIIDNNVLLDVFQNRVSFVQFSSQVLHLVEINQIKGFITANSITGACSKSMFVVKTPLPLIPS